MLGCVYEFFCSLSGIACVNSIFVLTQSLVPTNTLLKLHVCVMKELLMEVKKE